MDESSNLAPRATAAIAEAAADGWDAGGSGPDWTAPPPLLAAHHHPVWHHRSAAGGEEAVLGLIATLFGVGLVELLLSLGWIGS